MPFTGKGNITIAERSALEPAAHILVRSCREFEKRWSRTDQRADLAAVSTGRAV
jgi:hypothetical protein